MGLLTADDVAQRLGKTADYWLRKARKGEIPHRKIGRSRMWTEKDIEVFLESVKVDPLLSVVQRRK